MFQIPGIDQPAAKKVFIFFIWEVVLPVKPSGGAPNPPEPVDVPDEVVSQKQDKSAPEVSTPIKPPT